MNLAFLQYSINWFRRSGGNYNVELLQKIGKAKEQEKAERPVKIAPGISKTIYPHK